MKHLLPKGTSIGNLPPKVVSFVNSAQKRQVFCSFMWLLHYLLLPLFSKSDNSKQESPSKAQYVVNELWVDYWHSE